MDYDHFPIPEIEPAWFDTLLNSDLTYRVVYRRAALCPCQDERGAGPDPKCPVCHGVGYTWEPVQYAEYTDTLVRVEPTVWGLDQASSSERMTRGGVVALLEVQDEDGTIYAPYTEVTFDPNGRIRFTSTNRAPAPGKRYTVRYRAPVQGRMHAESAQKRRIYADRGEVQAGDLIASIPYTLEDLKTPNPAWNAGPHDRFILVDETYRYQQRMRRGRKETLTYTWIHRILGARAVVNDQVVEYAEGVDFQVNDGEVEWLPGRGPAPRTPYVLEYDAAPEYYVLDGLTYDRHAGGHSLPRRLMLRLWNNYPGRGR